MMLPFSLVGRYFFHRAADGQIYAEGPQVEPENNEGMLPPNGATQDESKCLHDNNQNSSGDSNKNGKQLEANESKVSSKFMVADEGESIVWSNDILLTIIIMCL